MFFYFAYLTIKNKNNLTSLRELKKSNAIQTINDDYQLN